MLLDDDILPPNLPRVNVTPQRPQIEQQKSEFDFLTPVSYLTGLQNLSTVLTKVGVNINKITLFVIVA